MRSIKVAGLLVGLMVLAIGLTSVPNVNAGPAINSMWTSSPPTIDGKYTQGEWSNLQIAIQGPSYPDSYVKPTYVYFMNDNTRLYVLVDASGDGTDGLEDECLLVFGFPPNNVNVEIIGSNGTRVTVNFDAAVGFYPSPNNQTAHKIYEFSIPFSYINAQPGQSLDFSSPLSAKHGGSMPYDSLNGHDNVWPVGLIESDINTYDRLHVGSPPSAAVGGVVIPVNTFAVLAPWLAVIGLVGCIGTVVVVAKKRRR